MAIAQRDNSKKNYKVTLKLTDEEAQLLLSLLYVPNWGETSFGEDLEQLYLALEPATTLSSSIVLSLTRSITCE